MLQSYDFVSSLNPPEHHSWMLANSMMELLRRMMGRDLIKMIEVFFTDPKSCMEGESILVCAMRSRSRRGETMQ